MTKNAFYFMLKALFVLEIFTVLSRLFGYVEKRLWLISKFITSQTEQQITTIRILPNISKSKGNQKMKIFFLKNYTQNVVEKLVSDHFIKNQN